MFQTFNHLFKSVIQASMSIASVSAMLHTSLVDVDDEATNVRILNSRKLYF